MPVLFIGHGSPMNALADNAFTQRLKALGRELPAPKAILCVSAHWMKEATWITHMAHPRTIHDFYGFPKPLFEVKYPAPSDMTLAKKISEMITEPKIHLDHHSWGFDHGAWSVLVHLCPKADIPVIQLSLDMTQPPEFHLELGEKLRFLRSEGVLILGSGNIVHNLGQISWETNAQPFDWALEFDKWCADRIEARDFTAVANDFQKTRAGQLSVPTLDHYLPLLYVLGASETEDRISMEYEEIQNASISMRCVSLGR